MKKIKFNAKKKSQTNSYRISTEHTLFILLFAIIIPPFSRCVVASLYNTAQSKHSEQIKLKFHAFYILFTLENFQTEKFAFQRKRKQKNEQKR
jgi:hypothetical protein